MLTQDLIDCFNKFFVMELVKTDKQREDMQRLRYDVYIDEFKFANSEDYPDKLEHDEYDDISPACIIYHISTNKPAACVRLVPAAMCKHLPIEQHVGDSIDTGVLEKLNFDRSILAEISRLAVARDFRRRDKENLTPVGYSDGEGRTYPMITVALFLACIVLADIINSENNIASMEPFLPRLIKRSGITFKQIGRPVDYHGIRSAYLVHKSDVINTLQAETRQLVEQIRHDFLSQMLMIY